MVEIINFILALSNFFALYPLYCLFKKRKVINSNKLLLLNSLLILIFIFSFLQHFTERNSRNNNLIGFKTEYEYLLLRLDQFFSIILFLICVFDITKNKFIVFNNNNFNILLSASIIFFYISENIKLNKIIYLLVHLFWHFFIFISLGLYFTINY